jgi:hypothetical protein
VVAVLVTDDMNIFGHLFFGAIELAVVLGIFFLGKALGWWLVIGEALGCHP